MQINLMSEVGSTMGPQDLGVLDSPISLVKTHKFLAK